MTKRGSPTNRLIKHFHFTSWNNFGLPKNLSHFLSFIRIINKWNKSFESKKVSVLIDFLITHTVTFLTHAKIFIVSVWNFIANNLLKHRFLIPFSFRNQSVVGTERAHTHLCTTFNVPPETLTITFGCHNCFYFTKRSLNITDFPVNISLECTFTKPFKMRFTTKPLRYKETCRRSRTKNYKTSTTWFHFYY